MPYLSISKLRQKIGVKRAGSKRVWGGATGYGLDYRGGSHWERVRGVLERGHSATQLLYQFPEKAHFQRQELSLWWERRKAVNGHELSFGVD